MALHPQCKAFLDQLASMGGRPMHEMTPAEARGLALPPELAGPERPMHSVVDRTVPIANSDAYVAGLIHSNVPFVYLRANYGGHGFGLTDAWGPQCIAWLHTLKF